LLKSGNELKSDDERWPVSLLLVAALVWIGIHIGIAGTRCAM
jgi:hypothetical protein